MTYESDDPRICPSCGQLRPHTGLTSSTTIEPVGDSPPADSNTADNPPEPLDSAFDFTGIPVRLSTTGSAESIPTLTLPAPQPHIDPPGEHLDEADAHAADEPVPEAALAPGHSPFRWLLPSYASALTLALLWMLATGRIQLRSKAIRPTINPPSVDITTPVLTEIPARFTVPIGGNLRIGELDLTPVEVRIRDVRLRKDVDTDDDQGKYRDGGSDSLWLRLRVRNTSNKQTFQPLDPTFVRSSDQGTPDSLIVGGGRQILAFPLAIASEWSIVGQSFPTLKPGQEADLWIVSAAAATGKINARMTWRTRLRVAPERTELLAIEFNRHDIANPTSL